MSHVTLATAVCSHAHYITVVKCPARQFLHNFLNKKISANNFGAKFEASGDPGWCHTGIQNHAVEVSTPAHNEQNCVVFGSHGKNPIFGVSGWYLCHMHNVRVGSFI